MCFLFVGVFRGRLFTVILVCTTVCDALIRAEWVTLCIVRGVYAQCKAMSSDVSMCVMRIIERSDVQRSSVCCFLDEVDIFLVF